MKILIIEDDPRIQKMLRAGIKDEEYELKIFSSAEQALPEIRLNAFDAIVLDIMLPGQNGLEFCQWVRDKGLKQPILMLTAKSSLEEKVQGLNAGADDYLTKPFALEELKARINALLRKVKGYPKAPITYEDLFLDPNTGIAKRGIQEVFLSDKESQLLFYLLKNHDRVVTRAMISDAVWENDTNLYTNMIDVFINHIRKKVDSEPNSKLIHSVRGKGFMLTKNQLNQSIDK